MTPNAKIAVVGATGVVGTEILGTLQERGYASEQLTLLASERSEGEELTYAEETLPVEKATPEAFRGIQLALFATPADVSKELCPAAQAAGARVVDVSSAFQNREDIPLVLPPLGTEGLKKPFHGTIVRCPGAIVTGLLLALEPLRREFGLREAWVTAMVSASSAGRAGVKELESQTADLLSGREPSALRFPHRLAFNLIPQVGDVAAGQVWTQEERSWAEDAARIWQDPSIRIAGTAIQVPSFYGHAFSVAARVERPVSEENLKSLWNGEREVKRVEPLSEKIYPMPMLITADPSVHLGRIRRVEGTEAWVLFFAVIDNAGRGAALNAVETGEALLAKP